MSKRNLWLLIRAGRPGSAVLSGYNVASLIRVVRLKYRDAYTTVQKYSNKEYKLETKKGGRIIAIHYLRLLK